MSSIFVSYSHEDAALARQIVQQLEAAGLQVWVDYQSIPPGADWELQISQGLKSCLALVLIQTPRSEVSPRVKKEWLYAEHLKKPIYPLLCEGDLWFSFVDVQYTDLRQEIDAPLSRLIATLPRPAVPDTINAQTATKVIHIRQHLKHDSTLNKVAFSPSGQLIGVAGGGGLVGVWGLQGKRKNAQTEDWFPGWFGNNVQALAFNQDDQYLVAGTLNNQGAAGLKIYDLENWREIQVLRESHKIAHLALTPDGQTLIAAESGITPRILIYTMRSQFRVDFQIAHIIEIEAKGAIRDLAVSPNQSLFATCGRVPNGLHLWLLPEGTLQDDFEFETSAAAIVAMRFQKNGTLLTTSNAGTIWSLDPGAATQALAPIIIKVSLPVSAMALNPAQDVLALAVTQEDKFEIQLWDIARQARLQSLSAHQRQITALDFSPDGKLLASTGLDGALHLWGLGG